MPCLRPTISPALSAALSTNKATTAHPCLSAQTVVCTDTKIAVAVLHNPPSFTPFSLLSSPFLRYISLSVLFRSDYASLRLLHVGFVQRYAEIGSGEQGYIPKAIHCAIKTLNSIASDESLPEETRDQAAFRGSKTC